MQVKFTSHLLTIEQVPWLPAILHPVGLHCSQLIAQHYSQTSPVFSQHLDR
jgi:hypothetical protein